MQTLIKGTYPFNSPYTYHIHRPKDESGGGISLTIPDQTMSLRELLDRYARGLPLDDQRVGLYDEEDTDEFDSLPDISKMDLADLEAYKIRYQEELEAIKSRQKPQDITHEDIPIKTEEKASQEA